MSDPSALIYLGYGFQNPKPGLWKVFLQTNDKTPASGADYAITAYFEGGAVLKASAEPILPKLNEKVELSVDLILGDQPLTIQKAEAAIRSPNGQQEKINLTVEGKRARASWRPSQPGLYGIDLSVIGIAPDGLNIERGAFLSVEGQPNVSSTHITLILVLLGVGLLLIISLFIGLFLRLIFRKSRHRA